MRTECKTEFCYRTSARNSELCSACHSLIRERQASMSVGLPMPNALMPRAGSFSGGHDAGTAARMTSGVFTGAGDVWVDTGSGNFQMLASGGGGGGGSIEFTAEDGYRHDQREMQDSLDALTATVEQLRNELASTTAALDYMGERFVRLERHCFPRNNE